MTSFPCLISRVILLRDWSHSCLLIPIFKLNTVKKVKEAIRMQIPADIIEDVELGVVQGSTVV